MAALQPATASQQRALALCRDLGDLFGQAYALNTLGVVQQETRDYPAAAASQQQALSLFGNLGDLLGALAPQAVVVALALGGAMLGFAYFNRPAAKLFLGDVGSLPIGLLLGWLLVLLAGAGHLAAALLLPLYYLADATLTLLRRLSSGERIWQAHQLQPHRIRTFKRSRDPSFAAKLADVVGLYVDPPAHAVVLSLDEKSQIQALDRTQPGLPIKPGRCQTMTHDYKRHGTTTLFAALSVLDGTVIGRCMQRHRHREFIRFLNAVEREVPAAKLIHAVLDNYATHKHPKVLAWLSRHPRWIFHFTPTSASWLNAVENFFSKMTRQRIRRGVFRSIVDLQSAINAYLIEHNLHPKPFVWTQSANAILAKLDRVPVLSECV